jgi:hypothetical protein
MLYRASKLSQCIACKRLFQQALILTFGNVDAAAGHILQLVDLELEHGVANGQIFSKLIDCLERTTAIVSTEFSKSSR